jgi:hypothetical protein
MTSREWGKASAGERASMVGNGEGPQRWEEGQRGAGKVYRRTGKVSRLAK